MAWLVIVAADAGGTGIGYFVWNEWNNLSIADVIIAILTIGIVHALPIRSSRASRAWSPE